MVTSNTGLFSSDSLLVEVLVRMMILPVSDGCPPPWGWKIVDSAIRACVGKGSMLPGLRSDWSAAGRFAIGTVARRVVRLV